MAVPSWLEIDLGEPETSPAASPPAWQSQFFHWLATGAAALVILIALGVAAADAWRMVDRGPEHRQVLNALRGRFTTDEQKVYYHKMSYASALTFLCCGAALLAWLRNRAPGWRGPGEPPAAPLWRWLGQATATLALLAGSWILLAFVLPADFVSLPTDGDWPGPFGSRTRMSPLSAGLFVTLGVALLGLFRQSRLSLLLAGLGGVAAGLFGLVFILGYIYGVQLFEIYFETPVALFTALSFFFLSVALIAALGPRHWPLRPFVGKSPRALMLRYLLPVVVAVLMLDALVRLKLMDLSPFSEKLLDPKTKERLVLYAATVCLGTAGAVSLVISMLANIIGGWLERSEAARDKALANFRKALKDLTQAKAALDHSNEELRKTNDELAEKNDDLNRAMKARTFFLAKVNHELRTPLTSIDLSIALLHKRVQRNGHTDYLSTLAILDDKTRYLTRLINDILDHAKLEARTMVVKPEWFCLATLLQDIRETMVPLLAPAGNTLVIEEPPHLGPVHADPVRLKQCLLNLLSNSNKVTRDGTLTVRVQREQIMNRDWLALRVADNGCGMTLEQQQRLFQPFVEVAKSEQKNYQGSGLGLVISRELCRLMGGEMILEKSELGAGSTFTIRLPVPAPAREQRAPAPALTANDHGAGNLVLVVDDDPDVCELLRGFLMEEGYQVETATGGLQGMEKARRLRPQAITLDVLMPDQDGWQVLSELKADPITKDIPVIMVSILSDVSMAQTLQAVDALPKPLDRDKLLRLLASYRRKSGSGLVLVIDDDREAGHQLQQTLEADGWSVAMAANAGEARQCLARQVPNLIVLDLMLPDMDGYAFISELQRHPGWDGIPILVVTGVACEAKTSTPNGARLVGGCIKGVLRKGEFTSNDLQDAVRSAVGS